MQVAALEVSLSNNASDGRVKFYRLAKPEAIPFAAIPRTATHEQISKARERQVWWHSTAVRLAAAAQCSLDDYLADESRRMARWAHGRQEMPELLRNRLGIEPEDDAAPITCVVTDRFGVPLDPATRKVWEASTREARKTAEDMKRQLTHGRKIYYDSMRAAVFEALNPKLAKSEFEPITIRLFRSALCAAGVPINVVERERIVDIRTDAVRSPVTVRARDGARAFQQLNNGGPTALQAKEMAAYVAVVERARRSTKNPLRTPAAYCVGISGSWVNNPKCIWHPSFSDLPPEARKAAHDAFMANPRQSFPKPVSRSTLPEKLPGLPKPPSKSRPPPKKDPEPPIDFDASLKGLRGVLAAIPS